MPDETWPPLAALHDVSAFFSRVPAFGYGIAYLLLIPAYAFVYWLVMPGDFYDTAVTHERQFLREIVAVRQELEQVLASDLRQAYGTAAVPLVDDQVLCLDRLRVVDFQVDGFGDVAFTILAAIGAPARNDDPCAAAAIQSVVALDAGVDLSRDIGDDGRAVADQTGPVWLPVLFTSTESQAVARRVLPPPVNDERFRIVADPVPTHQFALPSRLSAGLRQVVQATQGSAAGIPGEFGHLVYYSAVTVTTTGFGDIVPLTTRARLLTASEAIAGLILLGLFLNSLAAVRRRSAPAEAS